jgi:metal-responsive CopG/Arc/MetJ family transcriptional regulator
MSKDLKIKIPEELQRGLNEMSEEEKLKIREETINQLTQEEDRKGTIRMGIIFAIIIIIGILSSLIG